MPRKFAKYIIEPQVRKTSELPYHNDLAPGKRRVFLEKGLLDDSDIYVMVRTAKNVTTDQPEYVETHAHNVSSVYVFLGNDENLKGLTAEVILDHEVYAVSSPASVFIPKGVEHSYRLISGSGHFSHMVLEGDYIKSLVAPADATLNNQTAAVGEA